MNFADIEKTWQSTANRPSAAELEKHQMNLIDELRRSRRASRGLLWLTAVPLVLLTGRLFLHAGVIHAAAGHHAEARRWLTRAAQLRSTLLPSEADQLDGQLRGLVQEEKSHEETVA